MTTQIAVRLPDELVTALDSLVAGGSAPSRASVIERALRRELRRYQAEHDARIFRESGDYDELAEAIRTAHEGFPKLDS
jgi:Arc/MetJ-type ribon-helix-helix transcriptional regulator